MTAAQDLWTDLQRLAEVGGVAAVGVCTAEPWPDLCALLEARKAQGLHGGMAFTYRNPARSSDPTRLLPNAASLIVAAWSYTQTVPPAPSGPGVVAARVARYATADFYGQLRAALEPLVERLHRDGFRARIVCDDNGLVDREAARRAGIGAGGKNTNLLVPGKGSWVVLGAVVTDAALVPSSELAADPCGPCHRCLDACPTGALVAPGVLDASRCLAWLLQQGGSFPVEFRSALGDRIYGCDDCQEVCPPARRDERRLDADGPAPASVTWWNALDLLRCDDAKLLDRVGRWYIAERNPAVVRRNLLVVIGNSGQGHDPLVRDLVQEYATGADPVLAEHARWALSQLEVGPGTGEDGSA